MNEKTIKLLLIEDDDVDRMAFERAVARQALPYRYDVAGSVREARASLPASHYDVVLADYLLGDGTLFDVLPLLDDAPVIVLTGSGDTAVAVRAMKAGAYDYVVKDPAGHYLTALPLTIERVIERWRNEQELARYQDHLEELVEVRTRELARLAGVVKQAAEAVLITDPQGRIVYVNPFFEEVSGYRAEEVLGQNPRMLKSGEHPPDFYADLWATITTGEVWRGTFINRHKNGSLYYERASVFPVTDTDGQIINYASVRRDVTQRRAMEEALRESEERYRLVFQNSPVGIFNYDQELRITAFNERFCEILDVPRERLLHLEMRTLQDKRILPPLEIALSGEEGYYEGAYEVTHRPGRVIFVALRTAPYYDADGRLLGGVGIVLDITERKRAETALEQRAAQLTLINEIGSQIAAVLDLEHLMERTTRLIQETFGYYCVRFFVLERADQRLHLRSYAGELADSFSEDDVLSLGRGLVGRAATHRRRLLVNDLSPLLGDYGPVEASIRAELSVPLLVGNEVVGVLDIQSPERGAFDEGDVLVLETLADQIAVAIENARLHAGVQRELAERKQTETALRESEQRYRTLFEDSPISLWEEDFSAVKAYLDELRAEGVEDFNLYFAQHPQIVEHCASLVRILDVNQAALDAYGAADQAQLEAHLHSILRGAMYAALRRELLALVRGETHLELEASARTLLGNKRHVLMTWQVVPGYETSYARVIISSIDITARREAQLKLREQSRRMQEIVDTVPEGMLLLDAEGRILLANPVAKSYLDLFGVQGVGDVLSHLGERSLDSLLTSPPDGGLWHAVEIEQRFFEVNARPFRGKESRERWVLVLRDVTRERMMQQHVQQQERLAAVGQLAAGIAHDFNNLMAVIVLYADMALRSDVPPETRERMRTIVEQGKRATDLIQQLLDFSRRSDFERQPLDLVSFLKEQVKLLARTLPDNIELDFSSTCSDCVISGDPTRLQQAVMNLMVNARDAISAAGRICLTLDCLQIIDRKSSPLPEMTPGSWGRLVVQDTGRGISPDILPHVFDPFFTTKEPGKGSGLGLAQVYGIVKQHGGEIAVDSTVGQGTTFTLYFPVIAAPNKPPSAPSSALPVLPWGHGERVLIVEDNVSTRQALVQSLELLNYRVAAAADGAEALGILTEEPDLDLILSDLVMPRMGGLELLEELQASGLSIPIVFLSGHAEIDDLAQLQAETTLCTWLPKPVNLADLAETVAQALKDCR